MNKYQEALDRLCENNYFDEKGNCNCDLIVMDRILMQELVDKATPKKPLPNKEDQLKLEIELILLLDKLCPDCMLYMGVEEKYVIADMLFKGKFALSRVVDCNHIHIVIKESKRNSLSPKEVFKRIIDKGWLDDDK